MKQPGRSPKTEIPAENEDLRRFVRKKFCKSLFLTLFWELFWGFTFFYYYKRGYIQLNLRFILVLIGFFVLGLLLFGILKWVFDKSFSGTIQKIQYRQVMMISAFKTRHMVNMMRLRIVKDGGGRRTLEFPQKNYFDRYYHEGDKIHYYKGLAFPESGDGADKSMNVCCKCGGVELTETDICRGCGASLIKPTKNRYVDPFFDFS